VPWIGLAWAGANQSTSYQIKPSIYGENTHSHPPTNTASEFTGTLLGFDDYVNMVLEDVVEL